MKDTVSTRTRQRENVVQRHAPESTLTSQREAGRSPDVRGGEDRGPRFAVLGAGHGGLAMAGHLAISGFRVNLWNRNPERVERVVARGGIEVDGEVDGFGSPELATADIGRAIEDVDVVMIVTPAFAHAELAQRLAPHLTDGQIVVLNPGRTGGALEFAHVLRQKGSTAKACIAEAQTLIYVARHVEPTKAHIFQIKNEVPVAALPAWRTPEVLAEVRAAFPQFVAADNVLTTSLDNIGAIFHPTVTVLNAARIESTRGDFEYYLEGISPSVASVLETVDEERLAVASALGIRAHRARDWLYQAYAATGPTLYEAVQGTPGYKGVRAPARINHRYIMEDVPMSLVPIASLGDHLGVGVPTTKAIIHLASLMMGRDFWKTGRTVERMGLSELNVKEIRLLVVKGLE